MTRIEELVAENQRLREANRRLQAEGPALDRDKLISSLRMRIHALRTEIECDKRDPAHEHCRNAEDQLRGQIEVEVAERRRLRSLFMRQAEEIDGWLRETGEAGCKESQHHLSEGSRERVYWHYGRMIALRDVANTLAVGDETKESK